MIPLTPALDLGADHTRMKDRNEVARQTTTAERLLRRLFDEGSADFTELQLLADEVGMGKTFVALSIAYSVLEAQHEGRALRDCYQKVLVLVPRNDQLFNKWVREVGEIVKRCARPEFRDAAQSLFGWRAVTRPDELVAALCTEGPPVVVAKVSALSAGLLNRDLKRRVTLAAWFRQFGRALPLETRNILLKGAGSSWPADPRELDQLTEAERSRLPLEPTLIQQAIQRSAESQSHGAELLALCRKWGTHGVRGRPEGFAELLRSVERSYCDAIWTLLDRSLPLVIVDEAHHWKNAANGLPEFCERLAGRTRRALLLTATPFQLEPSEILSLLGLSDHLELTGDRRNALKARRDHAVKPGLGRAKRESERFASQWTALGKGLDASALRDAWNSAGVRAARERLRVLAHEEGAVDEHAVERLVRATRAEVAPELGDFVGQALRLYAFNQDLSAELGGFVVRHRRSVRHRVVRAGQEVEASLAVVKERPDAHVLHAAPGLDVSGDCELPFYLLMRATSELEARRTADLGCDLTGSYSTFFRSAVGRSLRKSANAYVELLNELVGSDEADARHPKVERVVREAVARWERGEKTLIFTFRVNTAKRLHALIEAEIRRRLEERRKEAFGGTDGLERLRQRLNTKTESLYALLLDRVLWSILWAPPGDEPLPFGSTDLQPNGEDYRTVARAALSFGQDVLERPDRVFLNRAAEFALARRLVAQTVPGSRFREVLTRIADESWIERPYGRVEHDAESDELVDERGMLSRYVRRRAPSETEVEELARALINRGRRSVVRQAFDGPSFWLGADPGAELLRREHHPADVDVDRSDQRFLHVHLRDLTWQGGELDFATRALALRAMRKIMLRESLLVRLLPAYEERETDHWATLLVKHFTTTAPGRQESLLRSVGVFIEDLATASGAIDESASSRGSLYETTRSREAIAALVTGETIAETRSRRFQGFNTPLSPEILVCGQIAQEGIDLHRHCSHVIHYDLAWNPATIEQRTGRIDRIGSRTQRLRQLSLDSSSNGSDERLEVSAPYLAGTYDERMFEELRIRAQTLEVLLGGDLAASNAEAPAKARPSTDDALPDETEDKERAVGLVPLPDAMAEDLRVDLAIWREAL